MRPPITIVGCGPGSRAYLTLEAVDAVAHAALIIGAPRVLALFPDSRSKKVAFDANVDTLLAVISNHWKHTSIAILVTGDPGVHSLARPIVERFGIENCRVIPGISSVQLALSRLGLEMTKTRILSAHHRLPDVDAATLVEFETVAVLTGHESSYCWIRSLINKLHGDYRTVRLSNLSLDNEQIEDIEVNAISDEYPEPNTIVLITRRRSET